MHTVLLFKVKHIFLKPLFKVQGGFLMMVIYPSKVSQNNIEELF